MYKKLPPDAGKKAGTLFLCLKATGETKKQALEGSFF
jgi:hypothetical protein